MGDLLLKASFTIFLRQQRLLSAPTHFSNCLKLCLPTLIFHSSLMSAFLDPSKNDYILMSFICWFDAFHCIDLTLYLVKYEMVSPISNSKIYIHTCWLECNFDRLRKNQSLQDMIAAKIIICLDSFHKRRLNFRI